MRTITCWLNGVAATAFIAALISLGHYLTS
jgi:hypothetical protein